MKRTCCMTMMFLALGLLLMGCSEHKAASETAVKEMQSDQGIAFKKPPRLSVVMGNQTIPAALGGYSWSYYDPAEGAAAALEAEAVPVHELVDIERAIKVAKGAEMQLDFEEPPLTYTLRAWNLDNNAVTRAPGEIKGKVIYEVAANWEQGKAVYAFAVDVLAP